MAYDPQRARPRHKPAASEPAPVDALLGPTSASDAPEESHAAPEPVPPPVDEFPGSGPRRAPLVIDLDSPAPAGAPSRRGRVVLVAAVAVSIGAQLVAWRWWRRRRAAARSPV